MLFSNKLVCKGTSFLSITQQKSINCDDFRKNYFNLVVVRMIMHSSRFPFNSPFNFPFNSLYILYNKV